MAQLSPPQQHQPSKFCPLRHLFLYIYNQHMIHNKNIESKVNDHTRTFLCSCEIFLQTISLNQPGHYYFVWYKGKRHTQSTKYHIDDYSYEQPIVLNEKMKMNLKLYAKQQHSHQSKPEIFQPKNTHFYLVNAQTNEHVCGFVLSVHQWGNDNRKAELQISDGQLFGTLIIKFKRSIVMQLDNFHKYTGEIEQSEEQEKHSQGKHYEQKKASVQMIRLQKQLEDNSYLIEKLKKDRNQTLAHNQNLSSQMTILKTNIKQEISRLQEHYKSNIEIRESIFREEIQDIISTFNHNSEISTEIMKSLVSENQVIYSELIATRHEFSQKLEEEREYIEAKQSQFEEEKTQLKKTISNLQDVVDELKNTKSQLQKALSDEQTLLKDLQVKKQQNQKTYETRIQEYMAKIKQVEEQSYNLRKQLDVKVNEILQKKKIIEEHEKTDQRMRQALENRERQLSKELEEKQQLQQQLEINKNDKAMLQQETEQLRTSNEKDQLQYEQKLRELEQTDKQHYESHNTILKQYQQTISNLQIENDKLATEVNSVSNELIIKQNELALAKSQFEQYKQNFELQFNETREAFDRDAEELKKEIHESQLQNIQLKRAYDDLQRQLGELEEYNLTEKATLKMEYDEILTTKEFEFQNKIREMQESNQLIEHNFNMIKDDLQRQNQVLQQELQFIKNQTERQIKDLNELMEEKDKYYQAAISQIKQAYEISLKRPAQFRKGESQKQLILPEKTGPSFQEKIHRQYLEEMQKMQQLLNNEQSKLIQKQLQIKEQQIQIEAMRDQLEIERENVTISKMKIEDSRNLMSSQNNKPYKLMIPKSYTELSDDSLALEIPSKSNIQKKTKTHRNKVKSQSDSSKSNLQNAFAEMKELSANLSEHQQLEKYQEAFLEKIEELHKQVYQLEVQKIESVKQNERLLQKVSEFENEKIEYIYKIKEYEGIVEEYENHINQLELKIEQMHFEMETKTPLRNINESKIQIRDSDKSYPRHDSNKSLRSSFKVSKKINKPSFESKHVQTQQLEDYPRNSEVTFNNDLHLMSSAGDQGYRNSRVFESGINKDDKTSQVRKQNNENQRGSNEQMIESKLINKKQAENIIHENQQTTATHQPKIKQKPNQQTKQQIHGNLSTKMQSHIGQQQSKEQLQHYRKMEYTLKNEISDAKRAIKDKDNNIQKLEREIRDLSLRNRQLLDQVTLIKQQMRFKTQMHESKIAEIANKELETKKSLTLYNEKIDNIKDTLQLKEQQFREKLENKTRQLQKVQYENQQLKHESNRYKQQVESLERKQMNQNNFDFAKTLQNQLEDSNKKILDLTRNLNHSNIERETAHDELNLIKKRLTELEKQSQQKDSKISDLQKQNDSNERKAHRHKRDNEDLKEECNRIRQQLKKSEEQLRNFNTFNTSSYNQRKKIFQQKLQLEEEVSKKDMQLRKMEKQIVKYKQQLEETIEKRYQNKNVREKQFERVTYQLQRANKTINEYEISIEQLGNKLNQSQVNFREELEGLRKSHADKLKYYIQEITNIKNIRDQSELELQNLRIENNNLQEQITILQKDLESSENKINELSGFCSDIEKALQQYRNEKQDLTNAVKNLESSSTTMQQQIEAYKKRLQKQQLIAIKKSEKLEEYQILNQKYIYQIKNLKVRLNQYETKSDITNRLTQQIQEHQNYHNNLVEELSKVNREYHQYRLTHQHTDQQHQQYVSLLKDEHQQQLTQAVQAVKYQYQLNFQQKSGSMQSELLKLYNQNAQHGVVLNQKQRQYCELLHRYKEYEPYKQSYERMKRDNEILKNKYQEMENKQKMMEKQKNHFELGMAESERFFKQVQNQLEIKQNECCMYLEQSTKLKRQNSQLQTINDIISNQLNTFKKAQSQNTQQFTDQLQKLSTKILASELENQRIKQRQNNLNKEYKAKISTLQASLKQLTAQRKQIQKNLLRKMEKQKEQLQGKIKRLEEENNSSNEQKKKLQRQYQTLSQQKFQIENQLGNLRQQNEEDEELYIMQINNLKKNLSDMQEVYNMNVANLQEELTALNRQLTQQRINKNELLRNSRLRDSQLDRRLEQRLKMKEQKIEELKNQIFELQEKVCELKKGHEENGADQSYNKYKEMYLQSVKRLDGFNIQLEQERNKHKGVVKDLKKELMGEKQAKQQTQIKLEQSNLIADSLKIELKTIKELYKNIQQEIDKRKDNLSENIEVHDIIKKQLQFKKVRNAELEEMCSQYRVKVEAVEEQLRSKSQHLEQAEEQLHRLKLHQTKIAGIQKQSTNWQQRDHKYIKQLEEKVEKLEKENRKLKFEEGSFRQQLETISQNKQELSKEIETLSYKYSKNNDELIELKRKFKLINDKSIESHGCDAEDLILGGIFTEKLKRQDLILQDLQEQLEELKFVENQKLMDYEELKRENFQLEMKLEETDQLFEQVESLQKICDKLEEEKKSAIFREEAIRIRLSNVLQKEGNRMKESISDILENDVY